MLEFTPEQHAFAQAVRDFCAREVGTREQRAKHTADGPHSEELYRKMAELGWAGIIVGEEYGGAGAGNVELCILLEEALRGMAPVGGVGPTFITAAAYEKFASEELKKEVLANVVAGDSLAIAMSEPEAGSDVANVSCKAEKVDGGWLINGQKTWISNAAIAKRSKACGSIWKPTLRWPITRWCSSSSSFSNLVRSASSIRVTGTPVQRLTTPAISSTSTSSLINLLSACMAINAAFACSSSFSVSWIRP